MHWEPFLHVCFHISRPSFSGHLPHFHTRCWILGFRPPCFTNIGRQEMLFSDWLDGRSSTCRPSIFGELGLGCPQVHLHQEGATARAKIVLLCERLSKEQGASAHFGVQILRSSADPGFRTSPVEGSHDKSDDSSAVSGRLASPRPRRVGSCASCGAPPSFAFGFFRCGREITLQPHNDRKRASCAAQGESRDEKAHYVLRPRKCARRTERQVARNSWTSTCVTRWKPCVDGSPASKKPTPKR